MDCALDETKGCPKGFHIGFCPMGTHPWKENFLVAVDLQSDMVAAGTKSAAIQSSWGRYLICVLSVP